MNTLHQLLSRLSSDQVNLLATKLQITSAPKCAQNKASTHTGQARLAAYVRLDSGTSIESLKNYATSNLPSYMQPSLYIPLTEIPKLPNGKYDVASFPTNIPNTESTKNTSITGVQNDRTINSSVTDHLIRILSDLMRIDDIRATDNFFEIGGDSITAIRFVSRARDEGLKIDIPAVTNSQTIADIPSQSQHLKEQNGRIVATGETPLTPIQQWFFDQSFVANNHWNRGGAFELQSHVDPHRLKLVIENVVAEYPALGSTFHKKNSSIKNNDNEWSATIPDTPPPRDTVSIVTIETYNIDNHDKTVFQELLHSIQQSFALENGWMFKILIAVDQRLKRQTLLWVAHHLVIDTLSESVLFEKIAGRYVRRNNEITNQTAESASLREWSIAAAKSPRKLGRKLPKTSAHGHTLTEADCITLTQNFETNITENIQLANRIFNTGTHELLLSVLATAWFKTCGTDQMDIDFEIHGRDLLDTAVDATTSVGWFTSFFPLNIKNYNNTESEQKYSITLINRIKQNIRAASEHHKQSSGHSIKPPQSSNAPDLHSLTPILFNFSGVSENSSKNIADDVWTPLELEESVFRNPANNRSHWLEINAGINQNKLIVRWRYPESWVDYPYIKQTDMQKITEAFAGSLECLVEFSKSQNDIQYTPSDFPELEFSQNELDDLIADIAFTKNSDQ